MLLVFTLPLMAIIALVIRYGGSGLILVWQQRMGSDGHLFNALRYRTLLALQRVRSGFGAPSGPGSVRSSGELISMGFRCSST